MSEIKKSYYAIIPANVRYDNLICANAKLLYGEITALSNEKGYCWASNSYFAPLYNVSNQAISKWIKQLERSGYIKIEYIYNGLEIKQRKVSINIDGYQQNDIGVSIKEEKGINKSVKGYQQKRKDNITYNNKNNNTSNSKPKKHKYGEYKNVLLKDDELEKLKDKFQDYEQRIKNLDEGIELKGYKYKSHYLAILKWAEKDKPKQTITDNKNKDYSEGWDD